VQDDKTTAIAYGLMDNKSAEMAEWNLPTLNELLTEVDSNGMDIGLTGFTAEEMADIGNQVRQPAQGLTDDDEIPEQVETVCKTGQLWQLGESRLLCGDCTQISNVERLMGGEKAELIV
jgi:hypothetical protein